jgi:tRNA dimethylallyltransferase
LGEPLSASPSGGPVVALFGATGTGKTAVACAVADAVPVRLISCDSVQLYRDLRAATAKPEGEETRHSWALVDWAEPHEDVNLGAWVRAAEDELRAAWKRRRLPLVAGGTGMYLRGLLKGVARAPRRNPALRERLRALEARHGSPWLHRVLARLDPPSADRIGPHDRQRLVRALEVRIASGRSFAGLQGRGWEGPDRWPALRLGLHMDRAALYARLDARVERFFERGLIDEVLWLLGPGGVPPDANALRAIGYREVVRACRPLADGSWIFAGDEAEVRAEVAQSTRRYAKRQMTWFRREPGTVWLDAEDPRVAERCIETIREWSAAFPDPSFGYTAGP